MRTIIKAGYIILFAALLLEFLLRLFDPLGIAVYMDYPKMRLDGDYIYYRNLPGTYKLSNFTATVLPDRARRVPDTNLDAACTVVAIGDSVTFGWGVNDTETWVNLLAREFPDVHFINAGTSGQGSRHIMISQDQWLGHADGMIYFINPNDIEDGYQQTLRRNVASHSYLKAYLIYAANLVFPYAPASEYGHFWFDLEVIFSHQNTLVFIDDPLLAFHIERRLPGVVNLIPSHRTRISPADPHPTVEGHRRIADSMRLSVEEAIQGWCK